jgi:hypothetical protein
MSHQYLIEHFKYQYNQINSHNEGLIFKLHQLQWYDYEHEQ